MGKFAVSITLVLLFLLSSSIQAEETTTITPDSNPQIVMIYIDGVWVTVQQQDDDEDNGSDISL